MPNAKLKTMTIDGVSNDVPVIEVGDYLKYDETLGKIEQVPIYQSGNGSTSVPTGSSGTNVEPYTIPCDGIAIISGSADFAANTTSYRYAIVGVRRNGAWVERAGQRNSACPTGRTIQSASLVYPVKEGDKVGFGFIQASGSALSVDYFYRVVIFPKTYE